MVGCCPTRVNSETLKERFNRPLELEIAVGIGVGVIPLVGRAGQDEPGLEPLRAERRRGGQEDLSRLHEPDVSRSHPEISAGGLDEARQDPNAKMLELAAHRVLDLPDLIVFDPFPGIVGNVADENVRERLLEAEAGREIEQPLRGDRVRADEVLSGRSGHEAERDGVVPDRAVHLFDQILLDREIVPVRRSAEPRDLVTVLRRPAVRVLDLERGERLGDRRRVQRDAQEPLDASSGK
jgi:hypothetical protein